MPKKKSRTTKVRFEAGEPRGGGRIREYEAVIHRMFSPRAAGRLVTQ